MASWAGRPFPLSDGYSKGKEKNLKTQLTFFLLISAPASLSGLQQSKMHGFPFDLGGYWPGCQDLRAPQVSTALWLPHACPTVPWLKTHVHQERPESLWPFSGSSSCCRSAPLLANLSELPGACSSQDFPQQIVHDMSVSSCKVERKVRSRESPRPQVKFLEFPLFLPKQTQDLFLV